MSEQQESPISPTTQEETESTPRRDFLRGLSWGIGLTVGGLAGLNRLVAAMADTPRSLLGLQCPQGQSGTCGGLEGYTCVPNFHNPEKFVCQNGFACQPEYIGADFMCFAGGATIFSCHAPITCNYENFTCPEGNNQYYVYC